MHWFSNHAQVVFPMSSILFCHFTLSCSQSLNIVNFLFMSLGSHLCLTIVNLDMICQQDLYMTIVDLEIISSHDLLKGFGCLAVWLK